MSLKRIIIAGVLVVVGIFFLKLPRILDVLSKIYNRIRWSVSEQYTEIHLFPPKIYTDDVRVAIFAIFCICAFVYFITPAVRERWWQR